MDRQIVYPGAIPLDTDVLNTERNVLKAIGYALQAAFGTGTLVDGLTCSPTSPASMAVTLSQGSIISLQEVDANAFGSLAADTNPLVKMGINAEGTTAFAITAPTTPGYSQNYLIEAEFLEAGGTPVVLPYYNASNPSQPYTGPSNSGTAQNTQLLETVALQLKAGTAAAAGTQTTPAVDPGYVGLYVITVNYGQTSITASSIVAYPTAPFIYTKLPQIRRRLTGNLSLYVNGTIGNDSNNGLSPITAFASLNGAWDAIVNNFDLNGYAVTVNIADGNYAGLTAYGALVGNTQGPAGVLFVGDTTTPANVTITGTNAHCVLAGYGAAFSMAGVSVSATGAAAGNAASGVVSGNSSIVIITGNVSFGSVPGYHVWASTEGTVAILAGEYTIAGAAAAHLASGGGGQVNLQACAVTITGTPAFSVAFAFATELGYVQALGCTYSGGATGTKYNAALNSVINTQGGGADYFPGSVAGTTVTGGQYV